MTSECRENLQALLQFKEIVDKNRGEWVPYINYDALLHSITDLAECGKDKAVFTVTPTTVTKYGVGAEAQYPYLLGT